MLAQDLEEVVVLFVRFEIHLAVAGAEEGGCAPRPLDLLVVLVEAEGVAPQILMSLPAQAVRNGRGIDTPGQQHADLHIGQQTHFHRAIEGGEQFDLVDLASLQCRCPIAPNGRHFAILDRHDVSRRQPVDASVEGPGVWDMSKVAKQIERNRFLRGGQVDTRQLEQGGDLRGDRDAAGECAVNQRLLAQPVSCAEQRPGFGIVEREGEHPVQPLDAAFAQFLVKVQDDLGIAVRRKPPPLRLQLPAQLRVVVDFSVVAERQFPRGGGHGLVAARAEVEDAQPPVRQAGGLVRRYEDAVVVGAAVREARGHRTQQIAAAFRRPRQGNTRNAAHRSVIRTS